MQDFANDLKKVFSGDIAFDKNTLKKYSRDYSIFEVRPEMVVYPKNSNDIQSLVKFVSDKKQQFPNLSITARAAGTDMSGGPLNNSIIMDITRYMAGVISVNVKTKEATVLPGTYYRDFEKACAEKGLVMPVFPASKDLCAVGGMVANNGAGEKSLKYGQNKDFVQRLKVVLHDGNEYDITPMTKTDFENLAQQETALGHIARDIWRLISENTEAIIKAKPTTSKNAAGYLLWDIWDETTQTVDLTKLFVGAQGTTGFITEITYKLVPIEKESVVMVSFVRDISLVPEIVNRLKQFDLETLEMYDDHTFKFAVKFFPDFLKKRGLLAAIRFGFSFIPEFFMMLRGGVPKFIFLSEFVGDSKQGLIGEAQQAYTAIKDLPIKSRIITRTRERDKYFAVRHESFKLLSDHSKKLHTAPFIDDVIVDPKYFPEYVPQLTALFDSYKLLYTVVGHIGNGNLHVIPLMDFSDPKTKEIILELSPKVYDLVTKYHGSITAEHNDGIIRTPYLETMFGKEMVTLFEQTKQICDPMTIFNPKKKVGGTTKDIALAIHI